jgi:hypothetical protein
MFIIEEINKNNIKNKAIFWEFNLCIIGNVVINER